MYAIRVTENIKVNQDSSRTQPVRSDSNLVGFFIRDCQMKLCTKCQQIKPFSEFHKRCDAKSGYTSHCKKCRAAHAKVYWRTNITERRKLALEAVLRHSKTDKFKATRKLYNQKHPEQIKARVAVHNAVKKGVMRSVKTLQCHYCSDHATIYHHYLGHAQKNALDVLPVCAECHRKIHREREFLF